MNKKTCILLTDAFPFGSGETFLETEILFLSKAFDQIYIFSLSGPNKTRELPPNVQAYSLNIHNMRFKRIRKLLNGLLPSKFKIEKKRFFDFLYCLHFRGGVKIASSRIHKIIKRQGIIISNDTLFYSYWFGFLAAVAVCEAKRYKIASSNIICRAHAVDLYDYRQKCGFSPFQDYLIKNIDYVCPISKDGQNYLLNKYPLFKYKFPLFRLGTGDHNINKEKTLGGAFNIVTCSNIIPIKRLDLVLNAIAIIKQKNYLIHWFCFGDGSDLSFLKERVAKNNLTDNVTFFGRVPNNAVYSFYNETHVDLFVNVSLYEGIPVSIMEAMSCGIPCIATNVGGTNEIISEDCGILLDKNINENILAAEILKFYSFSQNKKEQLKKQSRQIWEKEYNSKINYTKWIEFLVSLYIDKSLSKK